MTLTDSTLTESRPLAVLVTADLFLGTRLKAFAEKAGYRVTSVAGSERAIALAAESPARVVLDLTAPRIDVAAIVQAYQPNAQERVSAYAPHVRLDLLRAARAAGLRAVFTRSQLDTQLTAWLARPAFGQDGSENT